MFHVISDDLRGILHLPSHGIERFTDRSERILVVGVLGMVAPYEELLARNRDPYRNVEVRSFAVSVMTVRAWVLDRHVTRDDAGEKTLEIRDILANDVIERFGWRHMSVADLDWNLHERLPSKSGSAIDPLTAI
jgi:hypothetical protein